MVWVVSLMGCTMVSLLLRLLQGVLLGTLLVHGSGFWRPLLAGIRKGTGLSRLSEREQMAVALSCLIALMVEPLAYLLFTVRGVEEYGAWGWAALFPLLAANIASWSIGPLRRRIERWTEEEDVPWPPTRS